MRTAKFDFRQSDCFTLILWYSVPVMPLVKNLTRLWSGFLLRGETVPCAKAAVAFATLTALSVTEARGHAKQEYLDTLAF